VKERQQLQLVCLSNVQFSFIQPHAAAALRQQQRARPARAAAHTGRHGVHSTPNYATATPFHF
jgi:hypothetical protein